LRWTMQRCCWWFVQNTRPRSEPIL
jgi:hypothetical protein